MTNIHFFTEPDLLNQQSSNEAFGPLPDANGKNRYQVTSLHSAGSDPKAYAVLKGDVLVQDQTGSSNTGLVNVILRPKDQPKMAFPKIKYIIYRGIKKDSLIDSNDDLVPTNNNDLVDAIREDYSSLKDNFPDINLDSEPPKETLGIHLSDSNNSGSDPTYSDTDPIDKAFFREDNDIQLQEAYVGWSIGTFDKNQFGIEFILETIGFDPTLSLARKDKNIIEVDQLPSSPTQPLEFEHWHDKEAILNYIDPAAFYGMHYQEGVNVTSTNSNDNPTLKEKNEVYEDILEYNGNPIFANRNIVYLDLRNEFGYSFNYFNNYQNSFKVAYDASSNLTSKDYYADGWPIFRLDSSQFPSNTSDNNVLRIALPNDSDNDENPLPTFYLATGFLPEPYPENPGQHERIRNVNMNSGYTDEMELAIINKTNSSSTNAVASYVKLQYAKRFEEETGNLPSSGTVIRPQNYLDCIFPVNLDFEQSIYSDRIGKVIEEERYIDTNELRAFKGVFQLGISYDKNFVTLFAFPIIYQPQETLLMREPLSMSGLFERGEEEDFFWTRLAKQEKGSTLVGDLYEETNDTFTIFGFERNFIGHKQFKRPDLNKMFGFTIAKNDWSNKVVDKANDSNNFNQKYPVYLSTNNTQTFTDNNGADYKIFDLELQGFKIDSNSNLSVVNVSTGLKISTNE